MIDNQKRKKLNLLLSKIDSLERRNNFLLVKGRYLENIYFSYQTEIILNNNEIIVLKTKVFKLYITYF